MRQAEVLSASAGCSPSERLPALLGICVMTLENPALCPACSMSRVRPLLFTKIFGSADFHVPWPSLVSLFLPSLGAFPECPDGSDSLLPATLVCISVPVLFKAALPTSSSLICVNYVVMLVTACLIILGCFFGV